MLRLDIAIPEKWDSIKNEFVSGEIVKLKLEHSLVSVAEWECKWHKPFLSTKEKTDLELLDYIRCMTLSPEDPDPEIYSYLTNDDFKKIGAYISDPMTAAWFNKNQKEQRGSEQITNETIYYWMITLGIPSEYQYWHLNRLLTLIKVCGLKNQGSAKHKLTSSDLASRAELNNLRKKKFNTRG